MSELYDVLKSQIEKKCCFSCTYLGCDMICTFRDGGIQPNIGAIVMQYMWFNFTSIGCMCGFYERIV